MNNPMVKKYGTIAVTAAITVAILNRLAKKNATVAKALNG